MEDLNSGKASDVQSMLKKTAPSTEADFGYFSFQNDSQPSTEFSKSLSFSSPNDGATLSTGISARPDQFDSCKINTSVAPERTKAGVPYTFLAPVLGTPLSRPGIGLTRSSTTLGLRPRASTCTSTPRSSSPSFCRVQHISLGTSPNHGTKGISSFDSAYSSGFSSELLPSTTWSLFESSALEQNLSDHHDISDNEEKTSVPLCEEAMKVLSQKSTIQVKQELCCCGKLSCKFLSKSSPNISEKATWHSPQMKLEHSLENITNSAISSTPISFGFTDDERCKISKSALEISCIHSSDKYDLSVKQDVKQRCLSSSSPDLSPPKHLFSSLPHTANQLDFKESDSYTGKVLDTQKFVSKLENSLDAAYIPRAVRLDCDETIECVAHLRRETSFSVKDVEKVKRKLELDLIKNDQSLNTSTVEVEHVKRKLSPDHGKEDKLNQVKSFGCDASLNEQTRIFSQAKRSCEVPNLKFESLVDTGTLIENLPTLQMKHDAPNPAPVVKTGYPPEVFINANCTSRAKSAALRSVTDNTSTALPTFEFIRLLASEEAERFRSCRILLLLLDKTPYLIPKVLSYLPLEDILSFSQVNRQCRRIVAESKPLLLKVKSLQKSRLVAVAAVGKENLVYRHKNYHSDPGVTRRALGQVNTTVRSISGYFEPPVRQQLKGKHQNADKLVPFCENHLSVLHCDSKSSCKHHGVVQSKDGELNFLGPSDENCSSNFKCQDGDHCSKAIGAKRMFASDPHLYAPPEHNICLKNAAPLKEDFRVPLPVESENKKSSASRKPSVQSCNVKVGNKSEKLLASPRKILGAIQSAVSSIQAAVSPKKAAVEESPPKQKKSSRLLNFEKESSSNNNEQESGRSSFSRLQKCNMLNHANKVMSQKSAMPATFPLSKSSSEGNPASWSSLNQAESRCIVPEPSPIKCPPKKLALFSKATKKQLRRL